MKTFQLKLHHPSLQNIKFMLELINLIWNKENGSLINDIVKDILLNFNMTL